MIYRIDLKTIRVFSSNKVDPNHYFLYIIRFVLIQLILLLLLLILYFI